MCRMASRSILHLARRSSSKKSVQRRPTHPRYCILTNPTFLLRIKVSEKLNKIGPGSCEYVVADLSVSQPSSQNKSKNKLIGLFFHASNIQSKAGCDRLVEAIKAKEENIHILVNNSGTTWGAPYDEYADLSD